MQTIHILYTCYALRHRWACVHLCIFLLISIVGSCLLYSAYATKTPRSRKKEPLFSWIKPFKLTAQLPSLLLLNRQEACSKSCDHVVTTRLWCFTFWTPNKSLLTGMQQRLVLAYPLVSMDASLQETSQSTKPRTKHSNNVFSFFVYCAFWWQVYACIGAPTFTCHYCKHGPLTLPCKPLHRASHWTVAQKSTGIISYWSGRQRMSTHRSRPSIFQPASSGQYPWAHWQHKGSANTGGKNHKHHKHKSSVLLFHA